MLRTSYLFTSYFSIHHWACECRLIQLVMSISSITHQIDIKRIHKFLTIFNCKLSYFVSQFWIISIQMNNWITKCFSKVWREFCWSRKYISSCKSELIIHYDINRASYVIIWMFWKRLYFVSYSLGWKSCISMKNNIKNFPLRMCPF